MFKACFVNDMLCVTVLLAWRIRFVSEALGDRGAQFRDALIRSN